MGPLNLNYIKETSQSSLESQIVALIQWKKFLLKKIKPLINQTLKDLLIPIKYNFIKPKRGVGSCIFIHLTRNYDPTAGCVALSKKDFLIMLKLINKKTSINIS